MWNEYVDNIVSADESTQLGVANAPRQERLELNNRQISKDLRCIIPSMQTTKWSQAYTTIISF